MRAYERAYEGPERKRVGPGRFGGPRLPHVSLSASMTNLCHRPSLHFSFTLSFFGLHLESDDRAVEKSKNRLRNFYTDCLVTIHS